MMRPPTRALRSDEVESAPSMLERVEKRFGLKPERLIGDTAYRTALMLSWLVEQTRARRYVEPRTLYLDTTHDRYECRLANASRARVGLTSERMLLYRASKFDCGLR